MKEKTKKPQHQILVPKQNLTTKGLGPSSQELFDLMHLTSCDHAAERWKDNWLICPVCNGTFLHTTAGSIVIHRERKDITS